MAETLTYASLKTKIQGYAENDGTEFAAALDGFVADGEARISREIDLPGYSKHQFATLVSNKAFFTRPSDAITLKYLTVTDGAGNQHPISRRTVEFLNTVWPNRTTAAADNLPRWYAEFDETLFLLAPAPGAAFTIESGYRLRVPALSASNTTNILSEDFPDLLFNACMVRAEAFDKAFANGGPSSWEELYQSSKESAIRDAARYHTDEFQAGPSVT